VAEVEVDPDTGSLEVVKYTVADDSDAVTQIDDVLTNNGEIGRADALPAVMNAVVDAVGGKHIDAPATPQRVWQALNPPSLLWWGID
jgi:CO/xanthine dehydrogenase Mo-binding subunit